MVPLGLTTGAILANGEASQQADKAEFAEVKL